MNACDEEGFEFTCYFNYSSENYMIKSNNWIKIEKLVEFVNNGAILKCIECHVVGLESRSAFGLFEILFKL